jgi:very-short-patch-repair endonuclease
VTRKNRRLLPYAREMRRAPTPAERRVWRYLRTHPLGYKFRRQAPIGPFIVDFYCAELRLVLEIDGRHHAQPDMHEYDDARTMELHLLGLRVFRTTNDDVRDLQMMEQQIEWMIREVQRPPHPPSAPSPPAKSAGGEGR